MFMVTFLPKLQICALAQFVSIVTLLYQVLLQCSSHHLQLYVYYCLSSDNQTPLFLTTCLLVNSHISSLLPSGWIGSCQRASLPGDSGEVWFQRGVCQG